MEIVGLRDQPVSFGYSLRPWAPEVKPNAHVFSKQLKRAHVFPMAPETARSYIQTAA
jgi:hypothetical protein